MAKSALDEFKRLKEQTHALAGKAKEEALSKANEAIKDLNELGFNYQLTNSKGAAASKGTVSADAACPYCKFKTEPPTTGANIGRKETRKLLVRPN